MRCSYIFGIGIIFTPFSSNDADSTNEHPPHSNCTSTLTPTLAVSRESQISNTRAVRVFYGSVGTECFVLHDVDTNPSIRRRSSFMYSLGSVSFSGPLQIIMMPIPPINDEGREIGINFRPFSNNYDADSTDEPPGARGVYPKLVVWRKNNIPCYCGK